MSHSRTAADRAPTPGTVVHAAPAMVPGGMLASTPVTRDAGATSQLAEGEARLAESLSPTRRDSFVAGRIALRAALHALDPSLARSALLRTARGGPQTPPGVSGSVSHKRERAIALAAPVSNAHVGIDLEERPAADAELPAPDARHSLARRILTPRELVVLEGLDALAHRDATLLRFALKEAVYKAIDPWVQRHVRFTEVELQLSVADAERGSADVRLLLPEMQSMPLLVHTSWWFDDRWIVATAIGRPMEGRPIAQR